LADFIRNNDQGIAEASEKLLKFYREELLPCSSFAELIDVLGELKFSTRFSFPVLQLGTSCLYRVTFL
jgi:hypothetical protein